MKLVFGLTGKLKSPYRGDNYHIINEHMPDQSFSISMFGDVISCDYSDLLNPDHITLFGECEKAEFAAQCEGLGWPVEEDSVVFWITVAPEGMEFPDPIETLNAETISEVRIYHDA